MTEKFLTTGDVAEKLNMSVRTVQNLAILGKIPAIRIGGEWRIPEGELTRWLNKQRVDGRDIDYVY